MYLSDQIVEHGESSLRWQLPEMLQQSTQLGEKEFLQSSIFTYVKFAAFLLFTISIITASWNQ